MSPDTHGIPHNPIRQTNAMRPLRRIMRHPHQRILCLWSLRRHNNLLVIIRYLITRPFEQLGVYSRGQRPWWAARGRGFVSWEFETDEYAVGGLFEQRHGSEGPFGTQLGREGA